MQLVIFGLLGVITLGAALGVVLARNLFHSALWLILTFFGIAGIFILLQAEFLAVTQILVYVGAISILMIFAIMLSRGVMAAGQPRFNTQWQAVAAAAVALFAVLAAVALRTRWSVVSAPAPDQAIQQLGMELVGPYAIPFEVASVLLVVAMIGAILIAREHEA